MGKKKRDNENGSAAENEDLVDKVNTDFVMRAKITYFESLAWFSDLIFGFSNHSTSLVVFVVSTSHLLILLMNIVYSLENCHCCLMCKENFILFVIERIPAIFKTINWLVDLYFCAETAVRLFKQFSPYSCHIVWLISAGFTLKTLPLLTFLAWCKSIHFKLIVQHNNKLLIMKQYSQKTETLWFRFVTKQSVTYSTRLEEKIKFPFSFWLSLVHFN